MCYLITGISPRGGTARVFEIFDTVEEAMGAAEALLNDDYKDLAVWKQVGVPSLKKVIHWETKDGQAKATT